MEFIEAPVFSRLVADYLNDDDYALLQRRLGENPLAGDLIPGTGGFRKLRWPDPRRGKGKRGGLRIIYYHFLSDYQIWLLTLYNKDEVADLSTNEKKLLRQSIEVELRSRRKKSPRGKGRLDQ